MQTTLRPATPADQPFLNALFHEAHAHEFAPLHLPEAQLTALLQMQANAQRSGYATTRPHAEDRVILDPDGVPIGRILVDRSPTRIELVDIVLTAPARGQGIGTALIEDLKAQANGVPLRLQVRPDNPAFRLYTRLDFRLVGAGMQLELEYTPDGVSGPLSAPAEAQATPWDDAVGTTFDVLAEPPGTGPQLLLARIERYPKFGPGSYSLFFHGPLEPQLPQGNFALNPSSNPMPQPGQEEWLFLVPMGPRGPVMEYEAVFN